MAELRKCGSSWAFCDGNCSDCRTIATTSTQPDYAIGLLHDNSTVVWQSLPKKMVTRQERYEIEVGVCNSLNAQAGRFRYSDPWLSDLLLRAQETINKLLEKLGEEEEGGEGNG